jgi:hypothetical protein
MEEVVEMILARVRGGMISLRAMMRSVRVSLGSV